MAWPPFYTEASRAIPNFLVPILGDDRSACASCHRWGRTAGNYRLACTARKILCRLSHAGGNLRSLLALRGYRVDLSVPAALSDQSLLMNHRCQSASKLDALHTLRAKSGLLTSRQRMECVQLAGALGADALRRRLR